MTNAELLANVKKGLMITGKQFDDVLNIHIADVKSYLKFAGVDDSRLESNEVVGVILRGVSDLWNNSAGDVEFSPYFYDRVSQLVLSGGASDV